MHVRPLLVFATAMIAAAPAAADRPQQRSPERVPTSQLVVPMPAGTSEMDRMATPERKGKRVRYTFPAPKRVM